MSAADKTAAPARPDAGRVPRTGARRPSCARIAACPATCATPSRSTRLSSRRPADPGRGPQAHQPCPDAAQLPHRRCPAVRDHLHVPDAHEHPAVFSAVLHEEVHYFDVAYAAGCRWYRCHFPLLAAAAGRARAADVRRWRSSPARTTCSTRWPRSGSPATCPGCSCSCCFVTRWSGPTPGMPTRWPTASRPSRSKRPWNWSRPGWTARPSAIAADPDILQLRPPAPLLRRPGRVRQAA